jgi:hypothetical protein
MLGVRFVETLSVLDSIGTPRAFRLRRLGVVEFSVASVEAIGTSLLGSPGEVRSTAVFVPGAFETMGGGSPEPSENSTPLLNFRRLLRLVLWGFKRFAY